MIDINRHKFFMVQILKDLFSDIELAGCLGFKGGTALMFFYELPRFSVDLDFNLIDMEKEELYHFFPEIFIISKKCFYYNCTHIHEPNCAVLKAVEDEEISISRYNSYFNLFNKEDNKHRI